MKKTFYPWLADDCLAIDGLEYPETKLLPATAAYPDISLVFTNLMNASEQKHLQAFERCD
jgi:hypothetical protein